MRRAGINARDAPEIQKQLLLAKTLSSEIQEAGKENKPQHDKSNHDKAVITLYNCDNVSTAFSRKRDAKKSQARKNSYLKASTKRLFEQSSSKFRI